MGKGKKGKGDDCDCGDGSGKDGGKVLARMTFATWTLPMPNGLMLHMKVDLQEDGGVYVTHAMARRNDGGTTAGETCFYCGDRKLGCLTCPKGQSASGNCIDNTIKCVPNNAIGIWNPGSFTFKVDA